MLATSLFFAVALLNVSVAILSIGKKSEIAQVDLKKIEQTLQTESNRTKTISHDLEELKNNYKKLNKLLNKEITFKEGLKFVLAFEGGLSDDEGDTGGLTNMGITHSEYDEYRKSKGLSRRSVANISFAEASDIYKHTYWLNSGCSEFTRRVALTCFDWEVNSGRGVKTLQQTLGGVTVDGLIGLETLNELDSWLSKSTGENKLLHNYFEKREDAYRRWGVGSQAKFLQGWLRRVETLKDYLEVP